MHCDESIVSTKLTGCRNHLTSERPCVTLQPLQTIKYHALYCQHDPRLSWQSCHEKAGSALHSSLAHKIQHKQYNTFCFLWKCDSLWNGRFKALRCLRREWNASVMGKTWDLTGCETLTQRCAHSHILQLIKMCLSLSFSLLFRDTNTIYLQYCGFGLLTYSSIMPIHAQQNVGQI